LGDKNYVASLNQQIFGCGPEFPRLWDYPAIPPLTSNFSDKVFDELIHRCLSTKIRNPWKDLSKQKKFFHKWRESKKCENKIVPPKVFNQSFIMRRNLAPSQRKVGTGFVAPSFLGNVAIPKVTTTSMSIPMPFVAKVVSTTNHQQMTSSDSG
jgi:hypothetical protein